MHILCPYDCRPLLAAKVDVHPRGFYQMVDPASSKNCTVLSDIQIRICLSCQEAPAIHYISHKRPRHHEESIPTVVRRIHCYGYILKTRNGAYHVEPSLFPRCYIECQAWSSPALNLKDLTDTNDLLERELVHRFVCYAKTNRPHRIQGHRRQSLLAIKSILEFNEHNMQNMQNMQNMHNISRYAYFTKICKIWQISQNHLELPHTIAH